MFTIIKFSVIHRRCILYLPVFFISLIFSQLAYPQNKKIFSENNKPANFEIRDNNLTQTVRNNFSEQAQAIIDKMVELKKSGDADARKKILEYQRQLESLTGATYTVSNTTYKSDSHFEKINSNQNDNLTQSQVYSGGYILAIASQIEQRGATAGKIWLAVASAASDTGLSSIRDTLIMYTSIDNGATYTEFSRFAASEGSRISKDEMDMEIIENNSGTKYIYLTLGYKLENLVLSSLLIFSDSGAFGERTLIFPGHTANNKNFRPRITSDNSTHPLDPYVTIVITQDSVAGSNHLIMSKLARIYNPFTVTPAITFFSQSIYTPVTSLSNDYSVQTDIAYFNNSADSLIFVLSAYPGYNQFVYLYKAYGNTDVYPQYAGTLSGEHPDDSIEFARIASNGGFNNSRLLITYSNNYLNSGDWDQWIYYTSNAASWLTTTLDYTNNRSRYGDVIGKRGSNGYFTTTFSSLNKCYSYISLAELKNLSITNSVNVVNDNYANSFANPKPMFRNVNNDSTLTLWSNYKTLYSTGGINAVRLSLILAIEGFYNFPTDAQVIDDNITVELRNQIPPYNLIDASNAYLYRCNLRADVIFANASSGNYYVVVKHRNSIATWSAGPISLLSGTNRAFYDFTISSSQAYGNNLVIIGGGRWCIYGGDVNQDGVVDATDAGAIDNDAFNFVTGYVVTDLTGDEIVDASDAAITDNNAFNFVSVSRP